MEAYRSEEPDWEVLLDLDGLAAAEGEDWVWGGASTLRPLNERALIRLSRGGGDAVVLREFDIPARAFVANGFALPEAKGGAVWLDQDTMLLMTALGEGMATNSSYARTVRLWRRGEDPLAAPVIFEVPAEQMSAWAAYDRLNDRIYYIAQIGFYDAAIWSGDRTGPLRRIDVPTDAYVSFDRGALAVRPRTAWTVGDQTYPPDTVLGIGQEAFLAGARDFRVLFAPSPRRAFQGFFWCGGHLVISVLDNLRAEHLVFTPDADWAMRPLAGLPEIGRVQVWPLDADEDESQGELLATTQTPVVPPALLTLNAGGRGAGCLEAGAAVV